MIVVGVAAIVRMVMMAVAVMTMVMIMRSEYEKSSIVGAARTVVPMLASGPVSSSITGTDCLGNKDDDQNDSNQDEDVVNAHGKVLGDGVEIRWLSLPTGYTRWRPGAESESPTLWR